MIEVKLIDLMPNEAISIVQEIKQKGYLQGSDFDWEYHKVYSGWGFDMIFTSICREKAGVIHEVSMYHPAKPSYYDKNAAFSEMYQIYNEVYPKFMKDTYNEDCKPWDEPHREHEVVFKGI